MANVRPQGVAGGQKTTPVGTDTIVLQETADGTVKYATLSDVFTALGVSGGWTKISTITATGSETAFDFTSIPSGYKHLRLIGTARLNAVASDNLYCKVNNSGSGYNTRVTFNSGSLASGSDTTSNGISVGNISGTDATASYWSSWDWIFYDYLSTSHYKSANGQNQYYGGSGLIVSHSSAVWASTSAITRLTLQRATASAFVSGSTFDLYGIT